MTTKINQSSERPVRCEFKALNSKNIFIFFSLTRLIQNKQKKAISKHFIKPAEYSHPNKWNYFQRGCMDKWQSGDFSLQNLVHTFRSFRF